jgi:hypothetical protein
VIIAGWAALEQFLWADPRDAGCARAMKLPHVYVELIVTTDDLSHDPAGR